jgi:hypothetical protein
VLVTVEPGLWSYQHSWEVVGITQVFENKHHSVEVEMLKLMPGTHTFHVMANLEHLDEGTPPHYTGTEDQHLGSYTGTEDQQHLGSYMLSLKEDEEEEGKRMGSFMLSYPDGTVIVEKTMFPPIGTSQELLLDFGVGCGEAEAVQDNPL